MRGMQLEAESAAQNVVTQQASGARLLQRLFEALVGLEDFAVNVVVPDRDAHGVGGNRHAFDDDVRVELHDVAVFAGTRLTFV